MAGAGFDAVDAPAHASRHAYPGFLIDFGSRAGNRQITGGIGDCGLD
jgi:hypothetical protein